MGDLLLKQNYKMQCLQALIWIPFRTSSACAWEAEAYWLLHALILRTQLHTPLTVHNYMRTHAPLQGNRKADLKASSDIQKDRPVPLAHVGCAAEADCTAESRLNVLHKAGLHPFCHQLTRLSRNDPTSPSAARVTSEACV